MFKNIAVALTANTAQYQAAMTRAAASTTSLDAAQKRTQTSGIRVGRVLSGVALGGAVALAGGLAASVSAAQGFESSMNRVQALTGATGATFDTLSDQALELGSTTAFSASEAADGMGFLAQAGFEVDEILSAMPSTLSLAAAGQLELAEAADIASNVVQGFGLEADETARVNDVLAATSATANTNVSQLGDALSYAAPIANSAGYEIEATSAAVGALSDAGIQGSRAGTTLVGVIAALEDTAGPAGATLKEMGIQTHDANGNLLDLADIVEQLERTGLTAGEALDVFGRRAGPGMAVLVEQGADALRGLETRLDGAAGEAERIASVQMQGLEGAIVTVQSALEGLFIAVGQRFLPILTTAAEGIASILQTLAQVAAGASEEAGRFAGLVDTIGSAVSSLGEIVGQIVSAVGPIAGLVAMLGIEALASSLELVASIIAPVLGWIADTEIAVAALGTAIAVRLLPRLTAMGTALNTAITRAHITTMSGMTTGFTRMRVAAGRAADSFSRVDRRAAGMTGAFAGFAIASAVWGSALADIEEAAQAVADSFNDIGGELDLDTTSGQLEQLRQQVNASAETFDDNSVEMGRWGIALERVKALTPGLTSEIAEQDYAAKAAAEANQEYYEQLEKLESNLGSVITELSQVHGIEDPFGVISDNVMDLADRMGIDLVNATDEMREALIRAYLEGEDSGFEHLINDAGELASEMERAESALEDYLDTVRATIDPVHALRNSLNDYQEAMSTHADLIEETTELEEKLAGLRSAGKEGTDEYAEAEQRLEDALREKNDAAWDSTTALADLETAVLDGDLSFAEFERTIQDWASSGQFTDEIVNELVGDLENLRSEAEGIESSSPFTAMIEADADQARDEIDGATRIGGSWGTATFTSEVDAATATAEVKFQEVNRIGGSWGSATFVSDVDADNSSATYRIGEARADAENYGNGVHTAILNAEGNAWDRIANLRSIIASVPSQRTITFNQRVTGSAPNPRDSVVYRANGGVDFFANGSENHVAQIAPAGAWRVWAEPETGGEAYIPLAESKRGRSETILADVARRFGHYLVPMANGGVVGGGSGISQPQPMVGNLTINGNVDNQTYQRSIHKLKVLKMEAGR